MRRLAFVIVLAACGGGGGDDGGGDDGGPDADPGGTDPRFDNPANRVEVAESVWPGVSEARGRIGAVFADSTTGFLTETMRAGNCRLLTSDAGYCDACNGFCVDDVCQPWPTYRDAGRITIAGLSEPVSLRFQTGYYAPESFPLPTDLFDAGDAVTATAAGADFPAFSVAASGVSPIAPALTGSCDNELSITRGQDATINWPDARAGSRVRLYMPSVNNGHGLPPRAVIECEGPDTGEIRIPSALIDGMPDFAQVDGCDGLACVSIDCPPSTLARYTAGTATAGTESVTMRVQNEVTFIVLD